MVFRDYQEIYAAGLAENMSLNDPNDTHIFSHDKETIHTEEGCVEMCGFCMAALMLLTGHGISKNLCLCRNRTFLRLMHHQNLESTRPVASCFPGPDDGPSLSGNVRFPHMHGFLLYYCFCVFNLTRQRAVHPSRQYPHLFHSKCV